MPVDSNSISKVEFEALLANYPALVEAISESKGAKPGQKTLGELDAYRYGKALWIFSREEGGPREMTLSDVQTLVEWKLYCHELSIRPLPPKSPQTTRLIRCYANPLSPARRHGKFRPTLMKLVASNDANTVKAIISSAVSAYRTSPASSLSNANANARKALDVLTKLKGIGPATASLLLNVHDPQGVIFFSDEAYWWLCCGGKRDVIKYNAKEYGELFERATSLGRRLGVEMVDVEKVAYVLMKRADEGVANGEKGMKKSAKSKAETKTGGQKAKREEKRESVKRGAGHEEKEVVPEEPGLRRSKRRKA
ncbi:hypothetical protein QQS21_012074 [Conoideocrella luteorostrata]|uniref:Uncharacterized protein n=1 Tax=Conoideocrella luteorostrata TaxID=1105319 RepID=A0AAJ0CBV5_9HYPO|nr:hypothetical protein QQS21_012074 [Conoideocrella luteorostrata]